MPPEKRVLNVAVQPSRETYKPGQKATVDVKLTDIAGKPFVGSTVVAIYDKAVEYISGGWNVPEIKEFFWKWRRNHYPQTKRASSGCSANLVRRESDRDGESGRVRRDGRRRRERTVETGRSGNEATLWMAAASEMHMPAAAAVA